MLKKIIVLTAILAVVFKSNGQDISIDSAYQHNFFSISLRNGFNKTQITPIIEPSLFNSQVGSVPSLNFDYQWNVNSTIGISMYTGFGFYPFRFTFGADQENNIAATILDIQGRQNYQIYGRVLPGINFHKSVAEKLMFNATLRGGFASVGTSSGIWDFGDSTLLTYKYTGNIQGVISLETGFTYFLRNKDLVGLNISYEHFLQPISKGEYFQGSSNVAGTIKNKGHNIGLSLTYTFTQLDNKSRVNKIKETNEVSHKSAKKKFRKEKRFISPLSTFIGAGGTVFGLRSSFTDPNNYYDSNWSLGAGFYANIERGMSKNYFLELSGEGIQLNQNIRGANGEYNFGHSLYWLGRVSFGAGKRFILKESNRNIFNLHAGFSLNYTTREVGNNPGFGVQSGSGSANYFELNSTEEYKKQIFPTIYGAIEKDFRLAKMLYFSIRYKFDLGFTDIYEATLEYKTDENATSFHQATSGINGTTQGVSFGFKFKY